MDIVAERSSTSFDGTGLCREESVEFYEHRMRTRTRGLKDVLGAGGDFTELNSIVRVPLRFVFGWLSCDLAEI